MFEDSVLKLGKGDSFSSSLLASTGPPPAGAGEASAPPWEDQLLGSPADWGVHFIQTPA